MTELPCIKDHSVASLRERLRTLRVEPWRAQQIAGWLYQRGVECFDDMTDLSLELRRELAGHWRVRALEVDAVQRAKVAEIQVLGSGLAPEGRFVSPPLDLGRPAERKNFTSVRWDGQVPDGADLGLRFRSSDDGSTWSEWSAPRPGGRPPSSAGRRRDAPSGCASAWAPCPRSTTRSPSVASRSRSPA